MNTAETAALTKQQIRASRTLQAVKYVNAQLADGRTTLLVDEDLAEELAGYYRVGLWTVVVTAGELVFS
jgi:hypothetical protein